MICSGSHSRPVAGQVPTLGLQGHLCCPRNPSPASASSLALSLSSQEELAGAIDAEMPGELFYIFVNRVSERDKGPELINQERIQFGFYGHGYWSYFVGIFLFFY